MQMAGVIGTGDATLDAVTQKYHHIARWVYWKLSIQVLVRVYSIASLLTPQCLYSGDYVLAVLSDVFSVCL